MDHRFIARPRVVEAFQITREARADNTNWPDWLHAAWQKGPGVDGTPAGHGAVWPADFPNSDGTDQLQITPLDGGGEYRIGWDDWIVCHRDGSFRLYNPESFLREFEPLETKPEADVAVDALRAGSAGSCSISDDAHHESYMRQRAVEIAISAAPHIFAGGTAPADEIMAFAQKIVTFTSPLITVTSDAAQVDVSGSDNT